jgi:hypothetical protein
MKLKNKYNFIAYKKFKIKSNQKNKDEIRKIKKNKRGWNLKIIVISCLIQNEKNSNQKDRYHMWMRNKL